MAFLYILLSIVLCISTSESTDPMAQFCNLNTNISTTSSVSTNIDALLAKLFQTTSKNGLTTTSYGSGANKINGLAQCRGDVSTKDCSVCIQDAAKEIRTRCPNQADARIWYDFCFLRYNTEAFLGQLDTSYGVFFYNVENVTDPETFNKELGSLMDSINSRAVVHDNKGFGKGKTKLSPFVTLYAFSQCTRDLSKLSCAQCLSTALQIFPTYCNNKKGCRVLYSSCYVRYELYPIFFPLDAHPTIESTSTLSYASVVVKP